MRPARGWVINRKRRLYREMGLQLRNKTPKRKLKGIAAVSVALR